jgi:arabinan endo-1,5-alpha-L-arabinosidase
VPPAAAFGAAIALVGASLVATVLITVPALVLTAPEVRMVPPAVVSGDVTVHDPSLVRGPDGYQLYSTHDGIQARSSSDRSTFRRDGQALATIPAWVRRYNSTGDLWEPDVSVHDGIWWMYYAATTVGTNTSAIGLATSTTGAPGSFQDQGIVVSSGPGDNFNAIYPALLVDARGAWWLSFGSYYSGIYLIRIDPVAGRQSIEDQNMYPVAARPTGAHAVEAPYIVAHDGMYFLLVSFDLCCRGTNSTFRIMVGRSSSPTGPYYDKNGTPMSAGGGSELLASHDDVIGPGGEKVLPDGDGDVLAYHYYDKRNNGAPTLGMNMLEWDNTGWPCIH